MRKFENTIGKKFLELKYLRYHNLHKSQAMKALKDIQSSTNYSLSNSLKNQIDDYTKTTFGSTRYAYWLYVYTAFNEEFKEGWIPDNYFGEYVSPIINNQLGNISDIKTLTRKLINTDLVPDIAYKINNKFYDVDYKLVQNEHLIEKLFVNNNEEYYIKLDDSNQGKGVFKVKKDTFDLEKITRLGNFVIQKPIIHHEWFDEVIPDSAPTIRVTTIRTEQGTIETRASTLRVGKKKSLIVKHNNSIRIPISLKNGGLHSYGSDSQWKKYSKHPYSNFKFENKLIPSFTHAIKQLEKLHEQFLHYNIIGWDISIDETGNPQIIEWNAQHPGIKFHEAFSGPCFKDLNWNKLWEMNMQR